MYSTMFPSMGIATNAYNAQSLNYRGSKMLDPNYANDPKNAQQINLNTFQCEIANIRQLYCSRYNWTSDDPNLPVKYIESMLFQYGLMAFFHDDTYGWMLLPCTVVNINVYGEPSEVAAIYPTTAEVVRTLKIGEFILLRDNPANNIPVATVSFYARLIADTARTCEVYVKGMKKPVIMAADFDSDKTKKQFIRNLYDNESYILVDRSTIDSMRGTLDVYQNSTHNAQDLKGIAMYKNDLYNECVARLGIVTPTILKQAQVNKDEINKNDTMANIVLSSTYRCRQEATKEIYEQSGISLTCEIAPDLSAGISDDTRIKED